jgi:hypothetical protein
MELLNRVDMRPNDAVCWYQRPRRQAPLSDNRLSPTMRTSITTIAYDPENSQS